jgi:hypothetical protein
MGADYIDRFKRDEARDKSRNASLRAFPSMASRVDLTGKKIYNNAMFLKQGGQYRLNQYLYKGYKEGEPPIEIIKVAQVKGQWRQLFIRNNAVCGTLKEASGYSFTPCYLPCGESGLTGEQIMELFAEWIAEDRELLSPTYYEDGKYIEREYHYWK